jgi:uncharacterized membrane protein YkvA (DUF1232 family)
MPQPPDFASQLQRYVDDYRGPREISIRHAANLYRFYSSLFADPRLPREARPIVNAVIAYFVVADDVMPHEQHGPLGLVDDTFLAAHAYRQLCRLVDADLLHEAWTDPQPLDHVMATVYRDARSQVGKKKKEILRLSGLG